MSLQALGYVISTSSRVDHCSKQLDIQNVREFTWFFKIVKTTLFHQLPYDFISNLK